jgi:hypothetical protein
MNFGARQVRMDICPIMTAVEQIVGRERRERVSQLA